MVSVCIQCVYVCLIVVSCAEGSLTENDKPLKTWKERLGVKVPKDRVMSIGLELSNKNTASSELSAFRNALLETGSVDVLYRIQPDSRGNWQIDRALSSFRTDLAQWMQNSQLIWWEAGQVSELIPEDAFSEFARMLQVGEGSDPSWMNRLLNIFEPGNDIFVNEQEILQALGEGQPIGTGPQLALVRPKSKEIPEPEETPPVDIADIAKYALTVKTIPENARVRFTTDSLQYQAGILLLPEQYEIEVSREGYETSTKLITIVHKDTTIEVQLTQTKTEKLVATDPPDSVTTLVGFSAILLDSLIFGRSTVAFYSPSGKYLAVLSLSDRLVLYDRLFNELGMITVTGAQGYYGQGKLAFSPDEKYLAFSQKEKINEVTIARIPKLQILQTISSDSSKVEGLHFSSDSNFLALGSDDQTIKIWKLSSGQFSEVQTLKGHSSAVWNVSFSPDGKYLASGGHDSTVLIWQLLGEKFFKLQSLKQLMWIYSLSFNPTGNYLAVAGYKERIVTILKLSNGKYTELQILRKHRGIVDCTSFSPDGKFLVSGSRDNTIKIWKFSSGQFSELQTLEGHSQNVHSVSFSPDGKFLASGSVDKTVKIWKLTGVGGK